LARLSVLVALLWLLASWSGVHAHFSFDDHEPVLSAHMEITADHADHHAVAHQVDIDAEQLQSALSSTAKLDLLLLAILVLLPLSRTVRAQAPPPHPPLKPPRRCNSLRPPLRAPPAFPA
jgi:hypothetical protein